MKRLILIDDNEKPQPICYFELFDAIMNTKFTSLEKILIALVIYF